ncbi:hypothetical protein JHK84_040354 [Glycine max]|nr:hypothetical protein JHK84_040354 [Glycine max]
MPRRCTHWLAQRTPQWRVKPLGPKTLCKACGVRYKSGRLLPEYRPSKTRIPPNVSPAYNSLPPILEFYVDTSKDTPYNGLFSDNSLDFSIFYVFRREVTYHIKNDTEKSPSFCFHWRGKAINGCCFCLDEVVMLVSQTKSNTKGFRFFKQSSINVTSYELV